MRRSLLFLALLFMLWPGLLTASSAPALNTGQEKTSSEADRKHEAATLMLDNRPIVTFRTELYGYSPAQRVEGASARLRTVVDEGLTGPVSSHRVHEGTAVRVADHLIFIVGHGDRSALAGETHEQAAQNAVNNLSKALTEREESRRADTILRGIAFTVGAGVIVLIFVTVVLRARRWLNSKLNELASPRLKSIAIGGFTHHIEGVVMLLNGIVSVTALALVLSALYLWADFAFMQFPYTRPWGENLHQYMMEGIGAIALTIAGFIPGLIIVAVIFFITRFLSRLVRLFFDAVEGGRVDIPGLYADTAQPTRKIATVALWLFAIVMMYPYLPGSDSNAFKGMSVFVGLLLSIGSAGTVNQAVSGLMLMYSRALKVGDYVQIGDTIGTVMGVGWFSTRIRTPFDEIVTLPNAFVVGTTTKNYSHEQETGRALLTTTVTIGYNAPWRQVHAMLIEAANRTEGLLKNPPPRVLQRSLADYYVEYMLSAPIAAPDTRVATLDRLHRNIQDVFNEYGVQIMSPHYMTDPAEKVWVPKENWHPAPAEKDGGKT